MISDDNEISLTELISIISKFLNRRDSQFSIPKFFFKMGLKIIGKKINFLNCQIPWKLTFQNKKITQLEAQI